jgi:hypothetical protein
MGIWRFRRDECALGLLSRDVIMIIARLYYGFWMLVLPRSQSRYVLF